MPTTSRPSRNIEPATKNPDNGKEAGLDGTRWVLKIHSELNVNVNMLFRLFAKLWEKEEFLNDWNDWHILKLPKKNAQTIEELRCCP